MTTTPKVSNINDDQKNSFRDDANGNVARNTISSGGLAIPPHDEIQITYPTDTTEKYTYKLSSVTQAIIDLTYTDAGKIDIQSVIRSS